MPEETGPEVQKEEPKVAPAATDLEGLLKHKEKLEKDNKSYRDRLKELQAKIEELSPLADAFKKKQEAEMSELEKLKAQLESIQQEKTSTERELLAIKRREEIRSIAGSEVDETFLRAADDGEKEPGDVVEDAKKAQAAFLERMKAAGVSLPGGPGGTAHRKTINDEDKLREEYNELLKRRGDPQALRRALEIKVAHPKLFMSERS